MYGPEGPTCGGALSLAADASPRNLCDGLKMMAAGLTGATTFPPARVLTAGASASRPKLTDVGSWRNNAKPVGRSNGTASNTPTASACKANEVKVVSPRRERSPHDEWSVSSNMVSSWNRIRILLGTPKHSPRTGRSKEKRPRLNAAFGNFLDTHGVAETTWVVRSTAESPAWELQASETPAWRF